MNDKKYLWEVFKKISLCRNFELNAFNYLKEKKLSFQLTCQLVKKV